MQFFGVRDGGGSTDELTMCFDFIGMQAMYLSLARGDAGPMVDALKQRPQPPEDGHWATFVRNHDELTLDKLTEAQRQEVFDAFGPDEDMQLYGRGIRRRLPPMLEGDQRRIRLVYSMLFALPGTPVLFYGEEIGLGDNLEIEGRLAVRVPMQWTSGPGGGFSTADPSTFPEPPAQGAFSAEHVNVRDQSRDPDSLLWFFRGLVEAYRACPELAWGTYQVLDPGPDAGPVLAHRCDADGVAVVAVHNVGDRKVTATLPLSGLAEATLYDVLAADGSTENVGDDGTLHVTLPPYGFRWLRSAP
jgi:glycosidase